MEQKRAAELLNDNLKKIFAFSVSRLYNKNDAEDLTNEIVLNVMESVPRLQNDDAFYGFMWKIAENTFKRYIRKKETKVEYNDSYIGTYWDSPEDDYIKSEDINLLRRELSLLSKQYRKVTVDYYIHGKSCSQISKEQNLSVEMVKYYLIQTRKKLNEGFCMTREFGERSYNPGVFRMDFWGGKNSYQHLFDRSLPGNIVLEAYEKPVSLEELSIELGVSAAYLEDELEILLDNEIIVKTKGKYQTNIIIFTDECEKLIPEITKNVYEDEAKNTAELMDKLIPNLKALEFKGNNYNENRLKWIFTNIALFNGLLISDEAMRNRFGNYPKLTNGSRGFVYGYDNDYINHHFNGIYGECSNKAKTAEFSVENYRIIEKCQFWQQRNWNDSMEAMCDAILEKEPNEDNEAVVDFIEAGIISCENNRLFAEFPVFSEETYEEIKKILRPISESVAKCMNEISNKASEIFKKQTPKHLQDKCEHLCHIHYQMNTMAFIMETLVKNGYLEVPDKKENLCIFGIKKI